MLEPKDAASDLIRVAAGEGNWKGGIQNRPQSGECDHLLELNIFRRMLMANLVSTLVDNQNKGMNSIAKVEKKICDALATANNAGEDKIKAVLNGESNMWGVPANVNQLKFQAVDARIDGTPITWSADKSTPRPNWNHNKAAPGVISYIEDQKSHTKEISKQLFDVVEDVLTRGGISLAGYDSNRWYILSEQMLTNVAEDIRKNLAAIPTAVEAHCQMNPTGYQKGQTVPTKDENGCCPKDTRIDARWRPSDTDYENPVADQKTGSKPT
ncbi:hypothetical protein CBOM_02207 [Ceraceosorus bombacis]|uniref:Uncharacterized protein n=1 Tax=Ceraceosorus bombacis TaxID=401625 RepID=A0A0N7L9P4_9BASI|nr:hypothetical protein CBOM_02207 [Ceraceosorus bombacis]